MTPDEAVVGVLDALDAAGIPYMIVGSLASNFYGIPRSTRDADFVVEFDNTSLDRLRMHLPHALSLQPQGAFEAVTGTTRYVVDLAGSPFVCELFVRSDDAHDRERFHRRQRVRALGRTTWVASCEDMLVTKLRWRLPRRCFRQDVRDCPPVAACVPLVSSGNRRGAQRPTEGRPAVLAPSTDNQAIAAASAAREVRPAAPPAIAPSHHRTRAVQCVIA